MPRLHRWLCLVFVCLPASSLLAQDNPAEEKWQIDVAVTLSPGKAPVPALKYRLFPLEAERKPGDAAPIYLRFAHERSDQTKRDLADKLEKWSDVSLEQLPVAEIKKYLQGYGYILGQLELGARRQSCHWNYTFDVDNIFGILLPDAQEMRQWARLLSVKARAEIAEGNYPAALHTLETGFAFSRHIAEGPFLINALVGLACCNMMVDRLLELVDRADAPNLYWPLTALPRPLIDLRRGLEFEQRVVELQFPDLTDLERPRSPEEWNAAVARVQKGWEKLQPLLAPQPGQADNPVPQILARLEALPAAKKWLVETGGLKGEKIEAMPPGQVLLLALAGQYREWRDEWFKATYLPYAEAQPLLADTLKRLEAAPQTDGIALARAFVPALGRVNQVQARLERRFAALRVIEALRLHLAANKGELPDKLDQVKVVPIPLDPATGKPFAYQRDGQTATLSSRIPGESLAQTGLRYRLTLRK